MKKYHILGGATEAIVKIKGKATQKKLDKDMKNHKISIFTIKNKD